MRIRTASVYMLFAAAVLTNTSCADPSTSPNPRIPVEEVLTTVVANPNAVVLAVGDSLQMAVSAKNIFGDPLPVGSGVPIAWKTSAARTVSVDSTGVLHALKATSEDEFVTITASWTYNEVTRSVTVPITVTQTRLPIAGIRVTSTDSARGGMKAPVGASPLSGISMFVVDANQQRIGLISATPTLHDSMPSSKFLYLFLGRLGVVNGTGQYAIQHQFIGKFWIYAQANVYGVDMRDSLEFTGLYPATVDIPIVQDSISNALISVYSGEEVFVQPCGTVRFKNTSKIPIDIVFNDSTAAAKCVSTDQDGNIVDLKTNQTVVRKFPRVGTVQWTVRDPSTEALLSRVSGKITMKIP